MVLSERNRGGSQWIEVARWPVRHGRLRQFAADEIKEFRDEEQMSSGSTIWKNLVVVPRKGKRRTIAKGISSKLALDAAIDELKAALGRGSRPQ